MKTANDFKQAAISKNLHQWHFRDCSICDAPLFYYFSPDWNEVVFNSGCDCSMRDSWHPRTWQEIADHYNMQKSEKYRNELNDFWGFPYEGTDDVYVPNDVLPGTAKNY